MNNSDKKKSKALIAVISVFIALIIAVPIEYFVTLWMAESYHKRIMDKFELALESVNGLCVGQDEKATQKAEEFCNDLNLNCQTVSCIKNMYPNDFFILQKDEPFELNIEKKWWNRVLNEKDLIVYFPRGSDCSAGVDSSAAFIGFDCVSGIIDHFRDGNYLYKKQSDSDKKEAAGFISKKEAERILLSVFSKLKKMPEDLVFNGVHLEESAGIWKAHWLRQMEGYNYEMDGLTLGINANNGKLVLYSFDYYEKPLPEIKTVISKDEALSIGRKYLRKGVSLSFGKKHDQVYEVDELSLMLVKDDTFRDMYLPIKWENTRLAWVIKFGFTGGLSGAREKLLNFYRKDPEQRSKEDIELRELYKKEWEKAGEPPNFYRVKIDAETGKLIYKTPLMPWYMRLHYWSGPYI